MNKNLTISDNCIGYKYDKCNRKKLSETVCLQKSNIVVCMFC